MTYRRPEGGFHAAMTLLVRAFGRPALALRLGVSATRLDQMMNPARRDFAVLETALQADVAAAEAGLGTPFYDAFGRRLAEAGALDRQTSEARRHGLEAAIRAAAAAIRAALDGLESALAPLPVLQPVAANAHSLKGAGS